jgi:hypothetical protein
MAVNAAKKLIPLLDRVLVEKVAARTKTVGGILLPESAASKARARRAPVVRRRGRSRALRAARCRAGARLRDARCRRRCARGPAARGRAACAAQPWRLGGADLNPAWRSAACAVRAPRRRRLRCRRRSC